MKYVARFIRGHIVFAIATACKISSVTLGNGIQIIPEHAFDNCINLASVVIPESVSFDNTLVNSVPYTLITVILIACSSCRDLL